MLIHLQLLHAVRQTDNPVAVLLRQTAHTKALRRQSSQTISLNRTLSRHNLFKSSRHLILRTLTAQRIKNVTVTQRNRLPRLKRVTALPHRKTQLRDRGIRSLCRLRSRSRSRRLGRSRNRCRTRRASKRTTRRRHLSLHLTGSRRSLADLLVQLTTNRSRLTSTKQISMHTVQLTLTPRLLLRRTQRLKKTSRRIVDTHRVIAVQINIMRALITENTQVLRISAHLASAVRLKREPVILGTHALSKHTELNLKILRVVEIRMAEAVTILIMNLQNDGPATLFKNLLRHEILLSQQLSQQRVKLTAQIVQARGNVSVCLFNRHIETISLYV